MATTAMARNEMRPPGRSGVRAVATRVAKQHPVWTVFVVALAVRALLAVAIAYLFEAGVFGDDTTYSLMAEQMKDGNTQNWGAYVHGLYRATFTFIGPLTALYWLLWPSQLIGQLYVSVLGAGAAAAVTGFGLRVTERRWAIFAGLTLALLPSQVLFSALVLKDAAVWVAMATLALVVVNIGRSRGRLLITYGLLGAGLLLALVHLRDHTAVVAVWAVAISCWWGRQDVRWARRAGAVLACALIPAMAGLGPFGTTFIKNAGSLSNRRAGMAANARTAFVDPDETGGFTTDLRHLPEGISQMLLEPMPWRSTSNNRVQLARVETIVWYPLLALAIYGAVLIVKRRRTELYFLVLTGAATTVMYGLSEGNFGTAFRHRGELGWIAAMLAMIGTSQVVARRATKQGT